MAIDASKLRTWGFPNRLKDGAAIEARQYDSAPVNPYVSGYGFKIPTGYEVKLKDGKWRKVYVSCYANASRLWVSVCGDDCTLDIDTECMVDELRRDEVYS